MQEKEVFANGRVNVGGGIELMNLRTCCCGEMYASEKKGTSFRVD